MNFRITGLDPAQFKHFVAMSDAELEKQHVRRFVVAEKPGVPCRITLQDAEIGERALLLNYEHQSAPTPYRSTHAIFIREEADRRWDAVNVIPQSVRTRLLSVRAFDESGLMVDADVVEGMQLEDTMLHLFNNPKTAYLHLHNAKPGCYVARVDRVD